MFFGWGGEDDNLYARLVRRQNYRVKRYDANIGRYATLQHEHSEKLNTEMTLHKVSVYVHAQRMYKKNHLSTLLNLYTYMYMYM